MAGASCIRFAIYRNDPVPVSPYIVQVQTNFNYIWYILKVHNDETPWTVSSIQHNPLTMHHGSVVAQRSIERRTRNQ